MHNYKLQIKRFIEGDEPFTLYILTIHFLRQPPTDITLNDMSYKEQQSVTEFLTSPDCLK